jgi:hypothetical protein
MGETRRLQTLVGYVGTENSRHSGHTHAGENARLIRLHRRRSRAMHRKTEHLAGLRLMISSNFVGGMILPVCPGAAINVIGVYVRVLTAFPSK